MDRHCSLGENYLLCPEEDTGKLQSVEYYYYLLSQQMPALMRINLKDVICRNGRSSSGHEEQLLLR